jgi:hypothetical protein
LVIKNKVEKVWILKNDWFKIVYIWVFYKLWLGIRKWMYEEDFYFSMIEILKVLKDKLHFSNIKII